MEGGCRVASDLLHCPIRAVGAAVRQPSQTHASVFTLPFHLVSFLAFDHISAYSFNPPILPPVSAPFFRFHITILPHCCLIRKSDPSILHNVALEHTSPLPRIMTAHTLRNPTLIVLLAAYVQAGWRNGT